MVLAKHPDKCPQGMTFDSLQMFEIVKRWDNKWELVNKEYTINDVPSVVEIKRDFSDIEKDLIIPDIQFLTIDYTINEFKTRLDDWSLEQLEAFVQDERKSISNIAKSKIKALKDQGY